MKTFDFSTITEGWETLGDAEQRDRASLRYEFAGRLSRGRRYLEVGCGTAYGLRVVASEASLAVGGDVFFANLAAGRQRLPSANLVGLDGGHLPFPSASFDIVSSLESLYYFPRLDLFVSEAVRLLRPGGMLLLTFPNSLRPGFAASPGATHYPTLDELSSLLYGEGLSPRSFGAFSWLPVGWRGRALELMWRSMGWLHLMPKTLEGRARIKRLLSRNVRRVSMLEPVDPARLLVPLDAGSDGRPFKMLTVVAEATSRQP